MRSAEGRGPTLEEAVDAALLELQADRREVEVRVLSETDDETVVEVTLGAGSAAGSVGATALEGDPESPDAADARDAVAELLEKMGIKAQVTVRPGGTESITLDVTGRDLGLLIGWRGESLRALQTVTNMVASKRVAGDRRVIVDVERYRQRREHTVKEIAYRAARQVKATGDPITLDPMQPFERRSIHVALQDDPDVTTESVGQEPDRRIVVKPRSEGAE